MLRFITGRRRVNQSDEDLAVLRTAEVRWFAEGRIPSELQSAFGELASRMASQPARADHYLIEPETSNVGIKYREGRIEIKQRCREPRLALLAPGWEGHVEHWCKWSFPSASAPLRERVLRRSESWVSVRKKRHVLCYGIASTGQPIIVKPGTDVSSGCSVELTEVLVDRTRWWTLGFEATGPEEDIEHALRRVSREVLDVLPPCPFDLADSGGYPQWLQQHMAHMGDQS